MLGSRNVPATRVTGASFVAVIGLALCACGDDDGPSSMPADMGADVPTPPDDAQPDARRDAGPPPPDRSWALEAEGVRVTVSASPYRFTVADGEGREVLRTLDAPADDGYAALGWTTGHVSFRPGVLTKGHFLFRASLDPWRQGWAAVEATEESARVVEVALSDPEGSDARVIVRHEVRAGTLRVEARLADGEEPRAWSSAFASTPDEGFLGFGERFNRTNQRGVSVYSWAEEGGFGTGEGEPVGPDNPAPNGEAMSYYPVPFFLSTRRYAFWMDTTWRSQFDLATDHDDAWRVWQVGPTHAFEVYVPSRADARGWPAQLVDRFTETTGRPMLPPAWTFGPRRRINRQDVQDGVSEIQAMRDRDLAITGADDAVHFLPRGSHVGIEEELRAWVADGHRLGYRMSCYYNSLYSDDPDSPIRDVVAQGEAAGYFLSSSDGTPSTVDLISGGALTLYHVDVTSPEAVAYFQSHFDWALELGYDGWMQDFGEYVQTDVVAANGMTGGELHNLYPVLYDRAVYEHLESGPRAGDWLAFARAGYTGSSQYVPMVWSGDPAASFESADGLPSMVRAAINAGLSGIPHWGGDIGGFHCQADGYAAADGELLTRWIQQGSMTPNMQDQDACSFALDEGMKASIWSSADAEDAWRTYARLHTRLFPYLFALSHEAHATGLPLVRHLLFEHPDATELAGIDDQHYLGSAILVAPVVERGARERRVVFPEGRFLDWQDPEVLDGGREATVAAPLAKLPLFLREGHLVPMLDPAIDTLSEESHPDVVGPSDVADVYDVVAFVGARATRASFALWDGGELEVVSSGAFVAPTGFEEATSEEALATCARCYRVEELAPGLTRVRVSAPDGEVAAGGMSLRADVGRRVRWDVFVAQ
ncbi:MAG: glycoside hydrolase family 31 protein [Deltaproteobacteria bacterium]|nr:glycoside hydrolase family 31 protein [Deltaproteobacteria bacterium]